MRAQARNGAQEEEEESAFVSMTDMTVGFLFIIMILLAFFASQVRTTDTVPRSQFDQMVDDRNHWRALAEERELLIDQLEREKSNLSKQLDETERKLRKAEQEIDANKKLIANLERQLAELNQEIKNKDDLIAKLRIEIAELKAKIAQLDQIDPLEAYLAQVARTRQGILIRLRDAIKTDFPDLQVELSEESDALRFQGEGLFATGQSVLTRQKQAVVSRLATRLDEILPCYTVGQRSAFSTECNPEFVLIESVQIEGHTDNVGSDATNRNLSTARANQTFFTMTRSAPEIMEHRNFKTQPVLSVAAYGPDRPVATNDTAEGRATNRRIDLRFIMVTPQDTDGMRRIRQALSELAVDAE